MTVNHLPRGFGCSNQSCSISKERIIMICKVKMNNNEFQISSSSDFKELFCNLNIDKVIDSVSPLTCSIFTSNSKFWNEERVMEFIKSEYVVE